jgi:hypothetical protein
MSKDLQRTEMAFPVATVDGYTQYGMTLRDYFAGQVLIGLSIRREGKTDEYDAINAYSLADAMLKAREQ